MTLAAAFLALIIGLLLGLLGGGGSILTVPVFVYLLGFPAKLAIAMSLPVVCASSLLAAAQHARAGNVDVRLAGTFGIGTMLGAFAGARLSVFFSGTVQLIILAVVMLGAAFSMLRPTVPTATDAPKRHSLWLMAAIAVTVGTLTGIVGIGGGFLIVPVLVMFARFPMHRAVGTSLLIIALTTAAGFVGHTEVVDIPWQFVGVFAALAITGSLAGVSLSRRIPAAKLKRGFGVLLLVIAAIMLVQNIVAAT